MLANMRLSLEMLNKKRDKMAMTACPNQISFVRKKTRIKRILPATVCIILAIICITRGRSWSREGKCLSQSLTIQSEEGSFSGEWLQSAFAEHTQPEETSNSLDTKRSFAAWGEWKGEFIAGKNGGRKGSGDVIALCGPSRCLLPIGKNLTPQDKNGCIIGQKLAEELFGGSRAEGQKITWQGGTWTIRGVVQNPARLLMVQVGGRAGLMKKLHLNRINISMEDGEDRHLAGENFIQQNSLTAQMLRWDYLSGISWLREMVPGQWSDFDGWKENFQKQGEAARLARETWKSSIEAWGLGCRKKGGRLSLAGVFLLVLGMGVLVTGSDHSQPTKSEVPHPGS